MKNLLATIRKIVIVTVYTAIAIVGAFLTFVFSLPDSPEVAAQKAMIAAQRVERDAKRDFERMFIQSAVLTIKGSLRNPDSLNVRQAIYADDGAICITYAAQNGFGGMNVERVAFVDGRTSDYAKTCNGKRGTDHTSFAKYL